MIWGSPVIQVWNDTRVSKWQQNCLFWLKGMTLTIAPLFRFAILCWTWLWELWEQLHGACWCPKSIPFRQLSLCSEHTETDAGEGDRTQCLPPGHVQEKVWILWFSIIFTLVIHTFIVIILTLIHIASEMYMTMPRQTLCSKLRPILCLDMPRELLSVFVSIQK